MTFKLETSMLHAGETLTVGVFEFTFHTDRVLYVTFANNMGAVPLRDLDINATSCLVTADDVIKASNLKVAVEQNPMAWGYGY